MADKEPSKYFASSRPDPWDVRHGSWKEADVTWCEGVETQLEQQGGHE